MSDPAQITNYEKLRSAFNGKMQEYQNTQKILQSIIANNPNPDDNAKNAIQANIKKLTKIQDELPKMHKLMCKAHQCLYHFFLIPLDEKIYIDVKNEFNKNVEPILEELKKQQKVDRELDKLLEEIDYNSEQIKDLSTEMEKVENSVVLSDKPEEAADFNIAELMASLNVTESSATRAPPQKVKELETA